MVVKLEYFICDVCGRFVLPFNAIKHHISYEPENITLLCNGCHRKVHNNKDEYPELIKYTKEEYDKFYSVKKGYWFTQTKEPDFYDIEDMKDDVMNLRE